MHDKDRSERLDAFAAAEEHRAEMHRLLAELGLAETIEDVAWIEAEMTRVAQEYDTSLRTTTIAMRAENDQLAAKLRDLEERLGDRSTESGMPVDRSPRLDEANQPPQ